MQKFQLCSRHIVLLKIKKLKLANLKQIITHNQRKKKNYNYVPRFYAVKALNKKRRVKSLNLAK